MFNSSAVEWMFFKICILHIIAWSAGLVARVVNKRICKRMFT